MMSPKKIEHKANLLSYLSDWDNPWPKTSIALAKIVGITTQGLARHFTPDELATIKNEGLELRKKNSSTQRKEIYDAIKRTAEEGNPAAQKEYLNRLEGQVERRVIHSFDSKTLNIILASLPKAYADEVKQNLSEMIGDED